MDQHTYSVLYEREISLWKRDEDSGNLYLAKTFDNMEQLFQNMSGSWYYCGRYYHSNWARFDTFGSDFDQRQNYGLEPFDHKRYWEVYDGNIRDKNRWMNSFYCYLCYDCFDKHYSKDQLVGYYRIWRDDPTRRRKYGWLSHGWRRGAYGGYKEPRSTQERRWAKAWDDEEDAPKKGFARARRRGSNLPNAWDDCISRSEKSWKTQSKRKYQWKHK